jgi:hypothetical protein
VVFSGAVDLAFLRKAERLRLFRGPRHAWQHNIKMDLNKTERSTEYWVIPSTVRDQRFFLLKTTDLVVLGIPKRAQNS